MSSALTTMTVADMLVAYLNSIGIEYIFGVPGGAAEPRYDAMARRSELRGGAAPRVGRGLNRRLSHPETAYARR